MRRNLWVVVPLLLVVIPADKLWPADWKSEWKSAIESAKQEGKVVVAIPAQSDLRRELVAMQQGTRRLDVDTKWMAVLATKLRRMY